MMHLRSFPMKIPSSILPLAIVAACLASAAPAQQQATPAAPATAPAPPPVKKIPGLSDAGNALYAKILGPRDPQLVQIAGQQRQVQNQITSIAMGGTVDVDKFAGLLAKRDTLLLQFRTRQNELTVDMLHQMTDQDRGIYLRYSLTPPTPAAAR
jgi:succinate dehydrogenase flavin-adding protein (antitoxin of CptAB toxin-antitoxin module)